MHTGLLWLGLGLMLWGLSIAIMAGSDRRTRVYWAVVTNIAGAVTLMLGGSYF